MAITLLEEKKSKNYLIIILGIIIFLAIFIFVWRGFLIKPEGVSPSIIQKPPEIKINFEILNSSVLKELEPFEEIKPTEETIGRENPFLPYKK